ncbi:MAG: UbiD family decarboxylase [Pseudomonadota bacterium]
MKFKDLRGYLREQEKNGDLAVIKQEVDWNLEVGAIIRLSAERGTRRAPFFEKIKGYPSGRIVGRSGYGRRRFATGLGLSPDTSWREIQDVMKSRVAHPVEPTIVKDGPCKENIMVGDEVDLFSLPVPKITGGEEGRYIGTLAIQITKDPDSDWVNWGTYRMMVHDRNRAAVYFHRQNQGGLLFYDKYESKGKNMPMAVAIGLDPVCQMAAAIPFEVGESEVRYAGSLKQEPIELVKCETVDFYVPASAEIILEGEVLCGERLPEGPFGEWTRHQSTTSMSPVFRVNAITHRTNPIITVGIIGMSQDEGAFIAATQEIKVKSFLQQCGVPVVDVHAIEATGGAIWAVSVRRTEVVNIANRIADCIRAIQLGGCPVMIIVVDDDVDVFNLTEVMHTLGVRCHPAKGIKIRTDQVVNRLLPYLSPDEKAGMKGGVAVFDCTWPEYIKPDSIPLRCTFRQAYPKEVQERILSNWTTYGLE